MAEENSPSKQPSPKKPTPPPFKKTGDKVTDAEKREKGDWAGPKKQK
jgi:hypothetical protein